MQYDKEFKLQALELSMKSESGQHSRFCVPQSAVQPLGTGVRIYDILNILTEQKQRELIQILRKLNNTKEDML